MVDFQAPRGREGVNAHSEPLSFLPQQMRDRQSFLLLSLVLARKCVCQTPPPCAGAVSKGISPKGGAFSPPYGLSPHWLACFTVLQTLLDKKCSTLRLPLKLAHPLVWGRWSVKAATFHLESHGLGSFLSDLCHPLRLGKFSPRGGYVSSVTAGKQQHREVNWLWGLCRVPHGSSSHASSPWHLLTSLSVWCLKRPKEVCLFLTADGIFDLPQHFLAPWVLTTFTCVTLHLWSNLKGLDFSCPSGCGSLILSPFLAWCCPCQLCPLSLCQLVPDTAPLCSALTPCSLCAWCMAEGWKHNDLWWVCLFSTVLVWCWLGALQLGQEASWLFLEISLEEILVSALVCSTRTPLCFALEVWFSSQELLWFPAESKNKPLWFFLIHWAHEAVRGTAAQAGMEWGVDWMRCWDAKCTLAPPVLHPQLSYKDGCDYCCKFVSMWIWRHWRVLGSGPSSHSHSGGWTCLSSSLSHSPAWSCYSLRKTSSEAENQGVDGVQFAFLGFCAK